MVLLDYYYQVLVEEKNIWGIRGGLSRILFKLM